MADYGLLSASTRQAVVRRSFPLKNKAIKGYLYGTGEPPGLGNGLPNINLMPDISACVLTSDGTTAKVIWGRQDGSVVFVSHPRTMSGTQAPARVHTSAVRQEHDGAVLDGTWAASGDVFVTGGSDGRVKVWTVTVTPFRCTWTSEGHLMGREIDPILKVAEDLANGLIVAASRSGDIIIFSGFDAPFQSAASSPPYDIQELCISTRNFAMPDVEPDSGSQPMEISALFLHASSPTRISILAFYVNTSYFFRCSVDVPSKHVDVKTFGNAAFGIIRCIQPAFSNNPMEPSFVLVGTQLGIVSIYDWESTSLSSDPIPASQHVDVFSDAQVTSLAMNPFVIIAGSSRGTIMVLDILTFETLRSFTLKSTPNEVRQIELAGDLLVANAGSEVLAWSTSHFHPGGKNSVKIKGKGKQGGHGKWYKQIEQVNDIGDLVEEPPFLKHSFGPEREQLMQLHNLGLTELEAVEYTLMLSRDEELQKLQKSNNEHVHEEGIFNADESSNSQSGSDQSTLSSYSVRQYSPPPLRSSTSGSSSSSYGRVVPLVSPSSSNVKVQVSPRFYPEPMEAGGLFDSPTSPSEPQSIPRGSPSSFPSDSYSQSTHGSITLLATPSKQSFAGAGSPSGKPNAWNKPLPGTGLTASPPVPTGNPLQISLRRDWEVEAERSREVEDIELRFALELSLAEAQSRERNDGGT